MNKPNNGLTAMLSIGSESSYEITGAYEEGRLLGKEYKDAMSGPTMMLDDWAAALAAVPGSVERAAKLKASKNYDPGLAGLVIYVLNSGDYGWSVNQREPPCTKPRYQRRKFSAMSGSAGAVGSTCCGTGVS